MALLRIERAISWMAKALVANRDGNPVPAGIIDFILPNIDIFGTQRMAEVDLATVTGTNGSIEEFHTAVPDDNVRLYLSMSYVHDDPINRFLLPGRIIPTEAGFPFAGFRDQDEMIANRNKAVRNVMLGPRQRIAVRANAMGAAAKMSLTVSWFDMPVGEYTTGVR